MTYTRVIPRDLFNEANLLKCYGQIYINLERMNVDARLIEPDGAFRIEQNDATGGTWVTNVPFIVRGERVELERPLNSREPFPLYATTRDDAEYCVFNDDGSFTDEFTAFLIGETE